MLYSTSDLHEIAFLRYFNFQIQKILKEPSGKIFFYFEETEVFLKAVEDYLLNREVRVRVRDLFGAAQNVKYVIHRPQMIKNADNAKIQEQETKNARINYTFHRTD